jgi:DNA-3-methyladenine glycosylase II
VATDLATLRTAGLSGRKAEYSEYSQHVVIQTSWPTLSYVVHDLAARFADGRLSTEKLLQATDEELSEMLIDIYGIGKVGCHSCVPINQC